MALLIQNLKAQFGLVPSVAIVGLVVMLLAFLALSRLNDTLLKRPRLFES